MYMSTLTFITLYVPAAVHDRGVTGWGPGSVSNMARREVSQGYETATKCCGSLVIYQYDQNKITI